MPRAMVTIPISINPDLLSQINRDVQGKSQSARIRKCVELGYKWLTANPSQNMDREASPPSLSIPPTKR
jgi:hypothetical protein